MCTKRDLTVPDELLAHIVRDVVNIAFYDRFSPVDVDVDYHLGRAEKCLLAKLRGTPMSNETMQSYMSYFGGQCRSMFSALMVQPRISV